MEAVRQFIEQRIRIEDRGHDTPCWIWQLGLTPKGYAKADLPVFGRNTRVHRASYETYVGPIPDGLTIDHLCCVKSCCNPAHLEPVEAIENFKRWSKAQGHTGKTYRPVKRPGAGRGGWQRFKTHCSNGHEYTPENTAVRGGCRRCRTCDQRHRAIALARKREKRAAAWLAKVAGGARPPGRRPSLFARHSHHDSAVDKSCPHR